MTLSVFDSKILHFLYTLSKLPKFMSDSEIAKIVDVTRKTVANWLQFLNKPYEHRSYYAERKLSYFPSIFRNELGLETVNVFYENPSLNLSQLWPIRDFVGRLYDIQNNEINLAINYVVPQEHTGEFLRLVTKVKEMGLCSGLSHNIIGPSYQVLASLHEVIDENGGFHPERNDVREIDNRMDELKAFLEKPRKPRISPHVKRNPLIVPILAEYQYEQRTSLKVWKAMKAKLGKSTWNYLPRSKARKDAVGIKCVQQLTKSLHTLGLLNQMRVVYFPLEMPPRFCVWMLCDFGNIQEVEEFSRQLLSYSWDTRVMPISNSKLIFTIQVSGESLPYLFEHLSSIGVERLFVYDYAKWSNLVTTTRYSIFDYARVFDPADSTWKYSKPEMEKELESLA